MRFDIGRFIPKGSVVLWITTLGSYVLGLLRDRVLAHTFGASSHLDSYYAAFLIPDFIFLDINMPKMNGFECLSTIKSMQVYKDIPIILYSTGATENMKSKAIMLGAKDCIAKTNSIQSLADALQKIL